MKEDTMRINDRLDGLQYEIQQSRVTVEAKAK